MAERPKPLLNSSDEWSLRHGFGISALASTDDRKRWASAGIAPLTTKDRERFEQGRGISSMASRADQDAWVLAEIQAGRRPETDMPEAFGGRPTGSSRRAMRMQAEWDKAEEARMKQDAERRQIQQTDFQQGIQKRDQALQEERMGWERTAKWASQDIEKKASDEVKGFMEGLYGEDDGTGNLVGGLDPESPDYPVQRAKLLSKYPLSTTSDQAQKLLAAIDAIHDKKMAAVKEAELLKRREEEIAKERAQRLEDKKLENIEAEERAVSRATQQEIGKYSIKVDEIDAKIAAETATLAGETKKTNKQAIEQNIRRLTAERDFLVEKANELSASAEKKKEPTKVEPLALEQLMALQKFAKENPDDPRTPAIKEKLSERGIKVD